MMKKVLSLLLLFQFNLSFSQDIQTPELSQLDQKSVKEAKANFDYFMTKMKEKDLAAAKFYISESVRDYVTEIQLIELAKYFDFNKRLVDYLSGLQIGTDKKNRLLIQYKYEDDSDEIPKLYFKALFDEDGKLIIVQPIKRE
jgi:hypothetical protein